MADSSSLLSEGGLQLPERPARPVGDVDEVQAVINNIATLGNKMQILSQSVDKIGTRNDSREHRQNLRGLRAEMQELIKTTQNLLNSYKPPRDQKAKRDKLAYQFKEFLQKYEKLAKLSLRKEREMYMHMEKRMSQAGGISENLENVEEIYAGLEEVDVRIIEETNEDIKNLEKELSDLHETFVDVTNLVEEQREYIEEIETNVTEASSNAQEASKELREGEVLQQKARKKMVIIVILVILVIAGIGGGIAAAAG